MYQVDRDHDSLITLDEFTRYANTDLFNIKEEWKPVGEDDEHKEFTDDVSVCITYRILGNFYISFKLANFDVKISQYTVDNYVIIIIIRSLNNMKMNLKMMMIMIMMLMVISYVNLKFTQRLMNLIIIKHLLTILTFMKKKQLIIMRIINQLIMEYHWIMKLLLKENKDYLIIQIFLWEELITMVMHNHQVRFYLIFFIFSSLRLLSLPLSSFNQLLKRNMKTKLMSLMIQHLLLMIKNCKLKIQ